MNENHQASIRLVLLTSVYAEKRKSSLAFFRPVIISGDWGFPRRM